MRPVIPDVSLWATLVDLFSLLGGVQAGALLACVAGLVTGASVWALGRGLGMVKLSAAGKVWVFVAIVAAFATTSLPSLMGWAISAFDVVF